MGKFSTFLRITILLVVIPTVGFLLIVDRKGLIKALIKNKRDEWKATLTKFLLYLVKSGYSTISFRTLNGTQYNSILLGGKEC